MKHVKDLSLLLSIPLLNVMYLLLNNADRGSYSLVTDLDQAVPFLNIFVVPYLGWYLFIFGMMVYFCLKDKKIYYTTLWAINLSLLVSYVVYFFFQTSVPRPELVGNDFLTLLVGLVYQMDQPYNAFPSIHVLLCVLMMKAMDKSKVKNPYNAAFVYISAVIIILATQFIKQHVALDLLASIVLGEFIFELVYSANWETLRTRLKTPFLWRAVKKRPEI